MDFGYVYLICDPANDTYKIGVTRTLKSNRLKKLQTGNSTELHIVTYYKTEWPFRLETMLHSHFKTKQELNEWFALSPYDVIHFKEICNEMNDIIISLKDNIFFSKGLR